MFEQAAKQCIDSKRAAWYPGHPQRPNDAKMRGMDARIILIDRNHPYFGKCGRIIDADELAGR